MKTVDLKKQGFCKPNIQDPLFFYSDGEYVELTDDLYNRIVVGAIRL